MKRYNPTTEGDDLEDIRAEMTEHPQGEYVLFDELMSEIKKQIKASDELSPEWDALDDMKRFLERQ